MDIAFSAEDLAFREEVRADVLCGTISRPSYQLGRAT